MNSPFPFSKIRTLFYLIVIIGLISTPLSTAAQTGLQVIVHYVEGAPIEGQIAYDVAIYLSILDSNENPIIDLTPENFSVTEDSQRVEINNISFSEDEPINLILVLDTSGSMGGPGITAAREASKNFIAGLGSEDNVAIITFNDRIETQIDFTLDHQAAMEQIDLIDAIPNSGTCMYDATYQASQLAATLPSGRRAVILLSDGADTCSTYTMDDVLGLASSGNTRVPLYTIGLGAATNNQELERAAGLTGGHHLISPAPQQLNALFQRLLDQLKSQYILHYTSSAGPGPHNVIVEVERGGAQNQDARQFVLPSLPPIVNIVSPGDGQEVTDNLRVVASISGQGEIVSQVNFLLNNEIISSDNSAPYEVQLNLSSYEAGGILITVIAIGSEGQELSTESITVVIPENARTTPTPVPVVETSPEDPIKPEDQPSGILGFETNTFILIVSISIILLVIVPFMIFSRRKKTTKSPQIPSSGSIPVDSTFDDLSIFGEGFGRLIVTYSDDKSMIGHEFQLTKASIAIGRGANNDVILTDTPVSRDHAKIEKRGEEITLEDLGSTYGTFLNGKKVGQSPLNLQDGDEIQIGNRTTVTFEIIVPKPTPDMDATIDELFIPESPDPAQVETKPSAKKPEEDEDLYDGTPSMIDQSSEDGTVEMTEERENSDGTIVMKENDNDDGTIEMLEDSGSDDTFVMDNDNEDDEDQDNHTIEMPE